MANKDTIKLVSKEGFEFIIDRKAACISNTIKQMLSSEGKGLLSHSLIPVRWKLFIMADMAGLPWQVVLLRMSKVS